MATKSPSETMTSDELPFKFIDPFDPLHPQWICDYDMDGRITSILMRGEEKYVSYVKDLITAIDVKDTLVRQGWIVIKDPKVRIEGMEGGDKVEMKIMKNKPKRKQK